MFCKNAVKGPDRGKTGLQSYVDNGCFAVDQQSNGIIKPQTVNISWEGSLQNIAEGAADVTSANTKRLGNLFRGNGLKVMLLTICQNFLLDAKGLLACNSRDVVNNDGYYGGQQQDKAIPGYIFTVLDGMLDHRPNKTCFIRITPERSLQHG